MGNVKASFDELSATQKEAVEAEADGYGLGRGVQSIGDTRIVFVRYLSGGIGRIAQTGEVDLAALVAGGVQITQAEYDAALAGLDVERESYKAGLAQADADNTLNDYGELRAAGISEGAARRMSGYTGPAVGGAE